jgi:hypothetical protein
MTFSARHTLNRMGTNDPLRIAAAFDPGQLDFG